MGSYVTKPTEPEQIATDLDVNEGKVEAHGSEERFLNSSRKTRSAAHVQFATDIDTSEDEGHSHCSEEHIDYLQLSLSHKHLFEAQRDELDELRQKLIRSDQDLMEEKERTEGLMGELNLYTITLNFYKESHLGNQKMYHELFTRHQQLFSDKQKLTQEKHEMGCKHDQLVLENHKISQEKHELALKHDQLVLENEEMSQQMVLKYDQLAFENRKMSQQMELKHDVLVFNEQETSQQMQMKHTELVLELHKHNVVNQSLYWENNKLAREKEKMTKISKTVICESIDIDSVNDDLSFYNRMLTSDNHELYFHNGKLTHFQYELKAKVQILEKICLCLKRKNLGRFGRAMESRDVELERMTNKMMAIDHTITRRKPHPHPPLPPYLRQFPFRIRRCTCSLPTDPTSFEHFNLTQDDEAQS